MRVLGIDTASDRPIYEQIMDGIRTAVRRGELRPGDALPSVRQLASELGVNPNTAAKAYMLLEKEGVLRSVRRRGSFVADAAPAGVRRSAREKLGETLDRMFEDMERLGIDRDTMLDAVRRKLEDGRDDSGALEGGRE